MERNITSTDYNILLPVMPILSEYRPEDINPEFSFGDIDTDGNIKWAFVVSNDTTIPDGWEEVLGEVDKILIGIDIYITNDTNITEIQESFFEKCFYSKDNVVFLFKSKIQDKLSISLLNKLGLIKDMDTEYYFSIGMQNATYYYNNIINDNYFL